jgi:hypothetical protein
METQRTPVQMRSRRREDAMMTSVEWRANAHTSPGETPRVVDGVFHVGTIWTLTWKTHTAKAEVWVVPNVGMDLRFFIDGELHSTESLSRRDGRDAGDGGGVEQEG